MPTMHLHSKSKNYLSNVLKISYPYLHSAIGRNLIKYQSSKISIRTLVQAVYV